MVGPFAKVKLSHVIWRNLGAVTGGYNIVVLGGGQVRQWTSGGLRLLAISAEAKDCGDCRSMWQTSCIYGTPSQSWKSGGLNRDPTGIRPENLGTSVRSD